MTLEPDQHPAGAQGPATPGDLDEKFQELEGVDDLRPWPRQPLPPAGEPEPIATPDLIRKIDSSSEMVQVKGQPWYKRMKRERRLRRMRDADMRGGSSRVPSVRSRPSLPWYQRSAYLWALGVMGVAAAGLVTFLLLTYRGSN